MYNIDKRKRFTTVGELVELLKNVPQDSKIYICGDNNAWFHIEKDQSIINLDNEDLDNTYIEYDDVGLCASCGKLYLHDANYICKECKRARPQVKKIGNRVVKYIPPRMHSMTDYCVKKKNKKYKIIKFGGIIL